MTQQTGAYKQVLRPEWSDFVEEEMRSHGHKPRGWWHEDDGGMLTTICVHCGAAFALTPFSGAVVESGGGSSIRCSGPISGPIWRITMRADLHTRAPEACITFHTTECDGDQVMWTRDSKVVVAFSDLVHHLILRHEWVMIPWLVGGVGWEAKALVQPYEEFTECDTCGAAHTQGYLFPFFVGVVSKE